MNYHFSEINSNKSNLLQQLSQIDKQLENDKKKMLEQQKLQMQFYQDDKTKNKLNIADNKLSIADQIMNQLLKGNGSNVNLNKAKINHQINNPNIIYNNHYQNFNEKNKHQIKNFHQFPSNNNQKQQHQNRFINKRQLQKQRFQNQQSLENNPFTNKNQPVKNSNEKNNYFSNPSQKPILNQRQLQKIKLQQANNQQYPFWGQNSQKQRQKSYEKIKNQNNLPVYQNKRQMEKLKLQEKLNQYPLNLNNNIQDNNLYNRGIAKSPHKQPAQKDNQNQNVSKNLAFENRYSNPFVKDEDYLKQRKQQQLILYRRALQEQKKVQQQRKKIQKQKVKEQKIFAFNDYNPKGASNNNDQRKSHSIEGTNNTRQAKKIDPNGKPPVYTNQNNQRIIASSDMQYMKLKASEMKQKYKKGRIHYDQYIEQVKKLAGFYNINYLQLIDKKDMDPQQGQQLPWIEEGKKKKQLEIEKFSERQNGNNGKYQIIENEQSLEKIPESQNFYQQHIGQVYSPSKINRIPQNNQNYGYPYSQMQGSSHLSPNLTSNPNIYTQNNKNTPSPGLGSTAFLHQQFSQMDYELMRRMFDQMKAMRNDYTKSLESQKNFLQQTFIKMMVQIQQQQLLNTQQSQQFNSNMMTNNPQVSQISQINLKSNQNQQNMNKQTNFKSKGNMSPKPNKKYNNFVLQSENQMTDQSLSYIQKSLSGIVNKIPLGKNHIDPSFILNSDNHLKSKKQLVCLQQFFNKPYKIKKFNKFPMMIDISQSQMQIPNLSNFLALKNGKDIVNKLFQQDLIMMKKLQRQKQLLNLKNRVQENNNYGDTFNNKQNQGLLNKNYISKNISQPYSEDIKKNKTINTNNLSNNQFDEYQNYSRTKNSKQRQVKSAQLNHRSYRKVDQKQQFPSNAFIKKHISNHQDQQNFPNFTDQSDIKVRSPVYYSPKLNSEILEQDQYQTQQKSKQILESQFYGDVHSKKYQMKKKNYIHQEIRQSEKKKLTQKQKQINNQKSKSKSPQKKQNSRSKGKKQSNSKQKKQKIGMINILESHNQALSKYQHQPTHSKKYNTIHQKNLQSYNHQEQVQDIKQYSSINSNIPRQQQQLRNYFSNINNQNLSDKQNQNQSSKYLSNKFNSQKYIQNNESQQQIASYEESLQTVRSEEQSMKFNFRNPQQQNNKNKEKISPIRNSRKQQQESIQYSQSYNSQNRLGAGSINISHTIQSIEQSSSRMLKPPINKKKSTSKKKQSSIVSKTKIQKESNVYHPHLSNQNIKESQYKYPSIYDEKRKIENQKINFDSNVYESQYDQTVDAKNLQKKIQNLKKQKQSKINSIMNRSKQPQIIINQPVYAQKRQSPNVYPVKISGSGLLGAGGKLKSLDEARNLAKQSKKKASVNISHQNYEYKMSQLESFLTRRDQSQSVLNLKQQQNSKQKKIVKLGLNQINGQKKIKSPSKRQTNNKNIMNLLDDLQNDSVYREDFESYRQESQYNNKK